MTALPSQLAPALTLKSSSALRRDFDRIALTSEASEGAVCSGQAYEAFLLARLPERLDQVLEVGCGTGGFARKLAERSSRVVAVDLSPEMLRIARERSRHHRNIEYLLEDLTEWTPPAEAFDCVVAIATLHHLPMHSAISALTRALRPGGVLLLHDLVRRPGVTGLAWNAVAMAVDVLRGRRLKSTAMRRAWDEHGRGEVYPTLDEVRALFGEVLPGAEVRGHLLWRYTAVWRSRRA